MADSKGSTSASEKMSTPTRLLCTIGIPAALASIAYTSPPTAALTPILMAPTALAAYWRRDLPTQQRGRLETIVQTYLGTAVLGSLGAVALQTVLSLGALKLLFRDEAPLYLKEFQRPTVSGLSAETLEVRKQMAWSLNYVAYMALVAYPLAGFIEEGVKYLALHFAVKRSPPKHEYEYVVYAAAGGLGFATLENILFLYVGIMAGQTTAKLALTVVERSVFGIFGHGIMACLTGLRLMRSDARGEKLSAFGVVLPSALYHGSFDFMLFCMSAWNGNVGWIHPTDVASNVVMFASGIGLQGMAARDVWEGLRVLRLGAC
jgi:hypothetical protein